MLKALSTEYQIELLLLSKFTSNLLNQSDKSTAFVEDKLFVKMRNHSISDDD
jgi:hypothetical protein